MVFRWRQLLTALVFAVCSSNLVGAATPEALFVFDSTSPLARVLDANSLAEINSVPVGFGVSEAISIDGGYAVLSKSGVAILGESFELRGRLPLPAAPADAQPAIAYLDERRILAVATTNGVSLIDGRTLQFLRNIDVDADIASLMVNAESNALLILERGGMFLRSVDFETFTLSPRQILLPESPVSLPAAGTATNWFGGTDAAYEVGLLDAKSTVPLAPLDSSTQFGPWPRRAFHARGSTFVEFQPGNDVATIIDTSRYDVALPGPTNALVVGSAGRTLIGISAGRLFRYDIAAREVVAEIDAAGARSLSIVFDPDNHTDPLSPTDQKQRRVRATSGEFPNAATLMTVTENPLSVNALAEFPLTVAVFDGISPVPAVPVQITFSNGVSSCPKTGTTGPDGRLEILCKAAAVASDIDTQVRFHSEVESVTFNITVLASTGDGLFKIGGDDQITGVGQLFAEQLQVLASSGGAPQIGYRLNVFRGVGLSCPTFVLTGADGIGRIQCRGGDVSGPTPTSVNVGDGPVDAPFRTIPSPFFLRVRPPWSGQAARLELLSQEHYDVVVKTVIPNAVRVRTLGTFDIFTVQAPVFYSSDESDIVFSPEETKTDDSATVSTTVTIGCAPAGVLYAGVNPGVRDVAVTYATRMGGLANLEIVEGDGQTGLPGQRLDGQAVSWSAPPPKRRDHRNRLVAHQSVGYFVGPPSPWRYARGLHGNRRGGIANRELQRNRTRRSGLADNRIRR